MFRVVKSLILGGAVAGIALFAGAPSAEACDRGTSYYGGYPNYGYYSYSRYGGGYGGYGYGGYGSPNVYNSGYGYQTFYSPGSNFRGAPAYSAYPRLNAPYCR